MRICRRPTTRRAGWYLFGMSNLKVATRFWELPDEQRALIHNYALASCNHGFQFQFLRYLVEDAGLLAAGGEKNMVIFGVSYHCASSDSSEFFPKLWSRHGLFKYDPKLGIMAVKVNPWWRYIHFERDRMAGCLTALFHISVHPVMLKSGLRSDMRKHDPASYNALRKEFMGSNWKTDMRTQIGQFSAMVDYLLERKVRVVIVFLPQGTWEDNLPFERAYKEQVLQAFQGRAVPVLDWSKRLDDDDFADSGHANPNGVDKLQAWFLEIALPFLRSMHALPEEAMQGPGSNHLSP